MAVNAVLRLIIFSEVIVLATFESKQLLVVLCVMEVSCSR